MSTPLRRIAIERIELSLESGPAAHAELLAAQLEGALVARLGAADSARIAHAIAASLLDAAGEQTKWP